MIFPKCWYIKYNLRSCACNSKYCLKFTSSNAIDLKIYIYIGRKPKILDFLVNFIWSNCGFELMHLTPQLLCMMGICKYISVVPRSDTSFDMIKVEINCNYVLDAFF